MSKITQFDRSTCRLIGQRAEKAVQDALTEFGVNVKLKGGSFMHNNYTFKMEVATVAADGTVVNREISDFKQLAALYGLKSEDLGRRFRPAGSHKIYTITGLKVKSRRFPILGKDENGKEFKFPTEVVKTTLIPQ